MGVQLATNTGRRTAHHSAAPASFSIGELVGAAADLHAGGVAARGGVGNVGHILFQKGLVRPDEGHGYAGYLDAGQELLGGQDLHKMASLERKMKMQMRDVKQAEGVRRGGNNSFWTHP